MNYIIYHGRDLDGECSAAIAYYALSQRGFESNLELKPIDYGWPVPDFLDSLNHFDTVYILDFSWELELMNVINKQCKLTWIDHHTKRLKEAEEKGFQANLGQSLTHDVPAACSLTWRWFFPDAPIPSTVDLLSAYDSWQKELRADWDEAVIPFQLGMAVENTRPDSSLWASLLNGDQAKYNRVMSNGDMLINYRSKERQFLYKQCVPREWYVPSRNRVYRCLTLNSLAIRANFWDEVLTNNERNKYDLLVNYGYDEKPAWRVELSPADRKNGPDCSEIAAIYGGGGHAGRAGCQPEFPPFLTHNRVDKTEKQEG